MDIFLVITNTPNVSSFSFLFSLLHASFLFLSSGRVFGIQYWNIQPKVHTYRINFSYGDEWLIIKGLPLLILCNVWSICMLWSYLEKMFIWKQKCLLSYYPYSTFFSSLAHAQDPSSPLFKTLRDFRRKSGIWKVTPLENISILNSLNEWHIFGIHTYLHTYIIHTYEHVCMCVKHSRASRPSPML